MWGNDSEARQITCLRMSWSGSGLEYYTIASAGSKNRRWMQPITDLGRRNRPSGRFMKTIAAYAERLGILPSKYANPALYKRHNAVARRTVSWTSQSILHNTPKNTRNQRTVKKQSREYGKSSIIARRTYTQTVDTNE